MTVNLLVGSFALNHYLPSRKYKDLDWFSNDPAAEGDVYWDDALLEWFVDGTDRFATIDELYTIKVSHSYWDLRNGSWDKHMSDILLLKGLNATLIAPLHDILYRIWERDHGKKVISLQQDKEAFFTDAVTRIYDHDSIHYSVAYGDKPLYESVFKDGASIEMDMNKVKALPFEECVKLFREEIYATALERWIIPNDYKFSPGLAYHRALKKTITSLTKGWSAQFLVENYDIFARPDMNYVQHHKTKLDQLIKL